jgi:hypothetical protein
MANKIEMSSSITITSLFPRANPVPSTMPRGALTRLSVALIYSHFGPVHSWIFYRWCFFSLWRAWGYTVTSLLPWGTKTGFAITETVNDLAQPLYSLFVRLETPSVYAG